MKRTLLWLSCLVILLTFSVGAAAGTTVKGLTGLLKVPTADGLPAGELGLAYHLDGGKGVGSVVYGIADNIELGVFSGGSHSILGLHGKAVLVKESNNLPGLAVGICDESLYMVASKRLSRAGLRGHVGVGTKGYEGLFLGVSKMLNTVSVDSGFKSTGLPATLLAAEYVKGGFNLGAEVLLTPEIRVKLAAEDLKTVILGVSFRMPL